MCLAFFNPGCRSRSVGIKKLTDLPFCEENSSIGLLSLPVLRYVQKPRAIKESRATHQFPDVPVRVARSSCLLVKSSNLVPSATASAPPIFEPEEEFDPTSSRDRCVCSVSNSFLSSFGATACGRFQFLRQRSSICKRSCCFLPHLFWRAVCSKASSSLILL